jgi:hypothetical protein
MPIDWDANVSEADARREARKRQQARREARLDFASGTTLTPRDADDFARIAPSNRPLDRIYWKEFGSELRRLRNN